MCALKRIFVHLNFDKEKTALVVLKAHTVYLGVWIITYTHIIVCNHYRIPCLFPTVQGKSGWRVNWGVLEPSVNKVLYVCA